ncbi:metallophosphoesterase family protein [Haoranjiania flava]|uniref:Phosphoesterase n=1 Tax=Haoranjiania flava TaxID=1856322 RepID=A0AAE3IM44_9BACT|nr:metallophosphoesterase family protein [Haoranjiania flava]MCU7693545.1 metallophosphatase family protein [Haoranjiania flava]
MKIIGLLSDTHSFLPDGVFKHFADCDEVWHAGDFGSPGLIDALKDFKPLRGVCGNIDNPKICTEFPLENIFMCEEVKVYMKHIGGYPNKYAQGVKETIIRERPLLFISGHSHILKIMYDDKLQCLHINPGACGIQGWHKVQTLVKFEIDARQVKNCRVIELEKKTGKMY